MENESRVKLFPPTKNSPLQTRIPKYQSLKWVPKNNEGAEMQPQVEIFLTQNAYIRMCAHAGSDLLNEVGGWMAGKYCQDQISGDKFVVIDTVLPAPYTDRGSTHLTFTGDTQVALYGHLENYYPNKVLLGWYHTHPSMGVFFSHWDAWLHQNFFPHFWQVALVIEPHTSTGGFFIRQMNGNLDTRHYFGFYELTNRRHHSVVFWHNLQHMQDTDNLEKEVTL